MKAARIHAYGGSEALVYEDAPRPQPESGQVLIRVQAAGINPLDWKIRSGYMKQMMDFPLPLILGIDVAGTVEAVGEGVTHLQIGQEVYGMADMALSGAYAEYALAREGAIAPKPKTLDYVQAASVPVVAMTAWQALFQVGGLEAGQTVLIHAAAGGVGIFAVQFAKLKGARVIGTASAVNLDFVRGLGVDEVIDYKATRFEEAVSDVDMVLDTLGGETQERSWSVLKPGGILVSTVYPPSQETAVQRGVRAGMVMVQPDSALLKEIATLLDSGQVKTVVAQVLPLDRVSQAHELSQGGHVRGKLVLQVGSAHP
ncbi:MAG: NADP-dependent oxidoreductase [Chamaesiphon sp.]